MESSAQALPAVTRPLQGQMLTRAPGSDFMHHSQFSGKGAVMPSDYFLVQGEEDQTREDTRDIQYFPAHAVGVTSEWQTARLLDESLVTRLSEKDHHNKMTNSQASLQTSILYLAE